MNNFKHDQFARLAMTGKVYEAAQLLFRYGLISEPPEVIVKRFNQSGDVK